MKYTAKQVIGSGHSARVKADCLHHKIGHHDLDHGRDNPGGQNPVHVVDPGEAPDTAVQFKDEKHDDAEDGIDRRNAVERGEIDRDIAGRAEDPPHVVDRDAEDQSEEIRQVDRDNIEEENSNIFFDSIHDFLLPHSLPEAQLFIIFFHQFFILPVLDDGLGAVGVIGAHDGSHAVTDGLFPIRIGGFHQAGELPQELVVVKADGLTDVDQLVVGLGESLLGHELLFIELLARAETGILDLDIHIRLPAGEADHVAGQGVDLHWGTHVEDEDLAPMGIGTGQHHKAHGLGDGHEIADNIRMGDRDGAALFNLLPENRNDGSVGAQDVAEADGDELGLHAAEDLAGSVAVGVLFPDVGEELGDIGRAAGLDLGVEGLDHHLADALGGAHDVGRVHGLVGGNEDKALAAMDHGGVGSLIRSDRVVLDGLTGRILHEGDVLVGRGVIDDLGMVLLKDLEHAPAVADGTDQGHEVEVRILLAQFQLDGVGVVLIDIEDNQLLRVVPRDLAAELRTDGPAAACHEDDLAVDKVIDLMKVGGDGLAAQKVLDGDVLELRDGNLAGDQLIHAGEHLDLTAGLVTDAEDFFSVLARHAGDGEEDLGDMILLDILKDGLAASHDGDALDGAVPLVGVVVDDTDGTVIHLVRGLEVAEDHSSGLAGADDHDAAAGPPLAHHVGAEEEQEAEEEAQAHDKEHLEHGAPDVIGQGHAGIQHGDENTMQN